MKNKQAQQPRSAASLVAIGFFLVGLSVSFGIGGGVAAALGATGDKGTSAVAIQRDGKRVSAGYSSLGGSIHSVNVFSVVRLKTDGRPDPTFGTGGKITTAIGAFDDKASALTVQPDGKIVAAGYSNYGTNSFPLYKFALVRYNVDGSLDSAFGAGGKVTTAIGTFDDKVLAVAVQRDGKIIAAGYSGKGAQYELALVRYNADGSLDPAFGVGGRATMDIGVYDNDAALSVAVQLDGKVVVSGHSGKGNALVRYNTDGSLDSTLAGTGKVTAFRTATDRTKNPL